jgi:hypothetical protein
MTTDAASAEILHRYSAGSTVGLESRPGAAEPGVKFLC